MSNVNNTVNNLASQWKSLLANELEASYFQSLISLVNKDIEEKTVYPPSNLIFNAFNLTPFEKINVVIIGQDPYFNPNQANGLSFSVNKQTPLPPSLKNIFKSINNDIKGSSFNHGDLTHWAKQGVLLLNNSLTVINGKPNSHNKIGWETFTNAVISKIASSKENICFFLWGGHAHKKENLIANNKHLILKSSHPSPLSAYRGFLNCNHFSTANSSLSDHKKEPIDWTIY